MRYIKTFEDFNNTKAIVVNEDNKFKSAMTLFKTVDKYDYYIGKDEKGVEFYNIIPTGDNAPNGGYYSSEYISRMKEVPDLFDTK